MTRETPSNRSATARKTNKNIPVAIGKAIAITDNATTAMPRPTLVKTVFPFQESPFIILSIPTTNRTTAINSAMVTNVRTGLEVSTYIERTIAIIPSPICANLIHEGDLVSDNVIYIHSYPFTDTLGLGWIYSEIS